MKLRRRHFIISSHLFFENLLNLSRYFRKSTRPRTPLNTPCLVDLFQELRYSHSASSKVLLLKYLCYGWRFVPTRVVYKYPLLFVRTENHLSHSHTAPSIEKRVKNVPYPYRTVLQGMRNGCGTGAERCENASGTETITT